MLIAFLDFGNKNKNSDIISKRCRNPFSRPYSNKYIAKVVIIFV